MQTSKPAITEWIRVLPTISFHSTIYVVSALATFCLLLKWLTEDAKR